MNFLNEIKQRTLFAQVTYEEELAEHLKQGCQTAYVGFDPTADSLHVGHLSAIMFLALWQKYNNKAIVLIGGGTALIGDPSGKTQMRQMLTQEQIEQNITALKKQFSLIINIEDPTKGIVLNNAEWLMKLNYISFLREIGIHFSVNKMLTAECFKTRLQKGLSFLEFNYMLFQAYDFLHLYKNHNCTLQFGGDDQWSNMLAGVDLIRRITTGKAFCITIPLLVTSSGQKMGKTEKGAIWLDPNKTSPYNYYQYWRNIPDNLVISCLKRFTFLPIEQINELSKLQNEKLNKVKTILAFETTKIIHGEEEAIKAQNAAIKLFHKSSHKDLSQNLLKISLENQNSNEPVFELTKQELEHDNILVNILVKLNIFKTKSEVKRLIDQGGLSVNNYKVDSYDYALKLELFKTNNLCIIKKGKKNYYLIKIK